VTDCLLSFRRHVVFHKFTVTNPSVIRELIDHARLDRSAKCRRLCRAALAANASRRVMYDGCYREEFGVKRLVTRT